MDIRVGTGFDVHAFAEGRALILGGVSIKHPVGLLGACAMGDIGKHFPDTDPAYEGADSLALLRHCADLLAAYGWRVGNVDATVIAQAPKLAPHIDRMRVNLAAAMGIDLSRVSVKATTTEHLGFTGRKEGIAAQAATLVMRED